MALITFEHPYLLFTLLVSPAVYVAISYFGALQVKNMEPWGPQINDSARAEQKRSTRSLAWTVSLFCIMMIIALANPRYGMESSSGTMDVKDVYILIDVSKSMDATDLPPSRLEVAKKRIIEFIEEVKGNRIAIVLFAGEAYLAMPLTTDHIAAISMVTSLNSEQIATQGTNIEDAVKTVLETSERMGFGEGVLLMITDGEDHEDGALSAFEKLSKQGFTIFIAGAGTEQGATIMGPEGLLTDEDGNVVKSQLNRKLINEMAAASNGVVLNIEEKNWSSVVLAALDKLEKTNTIKRAYTSYSSVAFLPLLLAGMVLALGYYFSKLRIPPKKTIGMGMLLLLSNALIAQENRTFFQGNQKYEAGKFKEAEQKYEEGLKLGEDPRARYNLGNSQYKAGEMDNSIQNYEKAIQQQRDPIKQAKSWHNMGNAYYKKGQMKEAVEAYKQALRLQPGEKSSAINLAKAKQQLQQQQQGEQKEEKSKESNQQKESENKDTKQQGENREKTGSGDAKERSSEGSENQSQKETGWSENKAMLEHIEREEQKVRGKYRQGKGNSSKIKKPW